MHSEVPLWAIDLHAKIDHIHGHLRRLEKKVDPIMPTLADIQARADDTLAKITALADPLVSIKAVLDAKDSTIADQKKTIDDLIAAGGATPAQLQALSDTFDKILSTTDNQALAEAALANTPAAGTIVRPTNPGANPAFNPGANPPVNPSAFDPSFTPTDVPSVGVNQDGSPRTVNADGSPVARNPDGSVVNPTARNPDGSVRNPDGSEPRNSDGTLVNPTPFRG